MASRPIITPNAVVGIYSKPPVSGDMSASIISNPTILNQLTIASYSYSWTGTAPVGDLSIQVSNDYQLFPNGTVYNPGTWAILPIFYAGAMVSSIPISGNSGNGLIEGASAAWAIRTVYTRTSGIGTLQVTYVGKVM